MPEGFRQPSSELLDALAFLREREVIAVHEGNGQVTVQWCGPRDARAISRVILDRSADLWPYLRSAVRLASAAAAVERRGFAHFLYARVSALSPPRFRAAFVAVRGAGRGPTWLVIEGEGIRLTDDRMLTRTGAGATGYEITFAQMPRLVALLDVLNNTLGYDAVADVMAPLIDPNGRTEADDVARALRNAFNAWLAPRLDSPRHRQQAKLIHAFLRARASMAPRPDSIDDDAILQFWRDRAAHWDTRRSAAEAAGEAVAGILRAGQDEGFRIYRTTAQTLLRYRRCLQDAAVRVSLEQELSSAHGRSHESGTDAALHAEPSGAGKAAFPANENGPDEEADEAAWPGIQDVAEDWWSPLPALGRPPASRIKWLNAREREWLTNYLGSADAEPDRTGEQARAGESDAPVHGGGLELDRPFDLSFARTLLRVDVFGVVQSHMLARQRRGEPLAAALPAALGPMEENAYVAAVRRYREIEQQLRTEALAAIAILARSDVQALKRLLRALAPEDVCFQIEAMLTAERPTVIALRGHPPMQLAQVAELFRTGESQSAEVAAFASEVRRARASVQREGFRNHSEADPEWSKAFAASADALARLLGELRRLLDHFERHPGATSPGADAERFAVVLRMLYP